MNEKSAHAGRDSAICSHARKSWYLVPRLISMLIVGAATTLASCGGDGGDQGPPPSFTTQIQSDPAYDGDIQETAPATYIVTQGMSVNVQSIFAGIDPVGLTQFRAFLDFPLSGPGGVPVDAAIESAFLDIYVNSLQPTSSTLPLLIDLVSLDPPTLIGTDFDRTLQPALASLHVTPAFSRADVGSNTSIDVTALMIQAQQSGLGNFQLRIMEDVGPAIAVILEINDSTGADRSTVAPLLTVTYF